MYLGDEFEKLHWILSKDTLYKLYNLQRVKSNQTEKGEREEKKFIDSFN
jgi:hypothetical protein